MGTIQAERYTVDFEFANQKLERLYTAEAGSRRYAPEVVDAFFKVMRVIEGAKDEQDLRAIRRLHFEKLKGKRKHQRSPARISHTLSSRGRGGACRHGVLTKAAPRRA